MPREAASLLLGTYWWLWHQPMNIAFNIYPSAWGYLSMAALSFVIDSLYNLSERNLLAPMLAHQGSGTAITFVKAGEHNRFAVAIMAGLAMALRLVEHRKGMPRRFYPAAGSPHSS